MFTTFRELKKSAYREGVPDLVLRNQIKNKAVYDVVIEGDSDCNSIGSTIVCLPIGAECVKVRIGNHINNNNNKTN